MLACGAGSGVPAAAPVPYAALMAAAGMLQACPQRTTRRAAWIVCMQLYGMHQAPAAPPVAGTPERGGLSPRHPIAGGLGQAQYKRSKSGTAPMYANTSNPQNTAASG
jgi:hypothetical protein